MPIMEIVQSLKNVITKVLHVFFNIVLSLFPTAGMSKYAHMQGKQYKKYCKTFEDSKNFCVGRFNDHEAYPYEEYLLERFSGKTENALDFGCGMGRMINRMLKIFKHVDGADLMQENLEYAEYYLSHENGVDHDRYALFKTNGIGCKANFQHQYDFIYSTICLQHIAVHKTRNEILIDLFRLLKDGGQCCLQMGFGWDNGVYWFNNEYGARSTNAGLDVCIPDDSHLSAIEEDLKKIGSSKVEFIKKPSPHGDKFKDFHPQWIFIHLWKQCRSI